MSNDEMLRLSRQRFRQLEQDAESDGDLVSARYHRDSARKLRAAPDSQPETAGEERGPSLLSLIARDGRSIRAFLMSLIGR